MDLTIEIVAWIAAGLLLAAYALLSRGRMSSQGITYQGLNIIGSVLIGVNAFVHGAWPSFAGNVVWLGIGIATLIASRRRSRRTGSHDGTRAPIAA